MICYCYNEFFIEVFNCDWKNKCVFNVKFCIIEVDS